MRAFLPVMLLMAAGSSARADCSGFKDGAETFAKASFHTRFTRKGSKTDYKRAVVEWDPASMLDDLGCYEIENTELMYKVSSNILLEKNRYFSLSGHDSLSKQNCNANRQTKSTKKQDSKQNRENMKPLTYFSSP